MNIARLILGLGFSVIFMGCGGSTNTNTVNTQADANQTDSTQTSNSDDYPYIPKDINETLAIRFLNKATFGASTKDVENLQKVGVIKWLDTQLAMGANKDVYLKKCIEIFQKADPDNNSETTQTYLADNGKILNKQKASFHSPTFMMTSWFNAALSAKDQLRHKTAYALSQIIVESDFEPLFTRRGEALARYFDILYINSFSTYKKLLEDISFSSGMGVFLTFNGNQKEHLNKSNISIYPDENYAREIMQLFSIGLNELNIDGTPQKDAKGNLIPTYTQEDVNELSKVFTGWDIKYNTDRFGRVGFTVGDFTHPMEFTSKYHDYSEKRLLGSTIERGLSGEADIKRAIEIIMNNKNVAPYISKNLIMRLTKSNPSKQYIKRVATKFQSSNSDLKEVIKAIFLDPELWDDLKADRHVKFKEPLIAYTQFLRAFYAKPFPKWYFCGYGAPKDDQASNCHIVKNEFLFNGTRKYLNQGPGLAPTVFNFYDNDYIPNDNTFKNTNAVAPEIQIQSDTMLIGFSNKIYSDFTHWEKGAILERYHKDANGDSVQDKTLEEYATRDVIKNIPIYYVGSDKMLLDAQEEYDVLEMVIDGDTNGDYTNLKDNAVKDYHDDEKALRALIEFEDMKLTGGKLTKEQKDILYDNLKVNIYNKYNGSTKKYQLFHNLILPIVRAIVTSDSYMVE
jgi:uncharacterized protein (DUF1800 family)